MASKRKRAPDRRREKRDKTGDGSPAKRNAVAAVIGVGDPKAKPKNAGVEVEVETGGQTKPTSFPVVGIGASAGGLAALEEFFENVPLDSGMAFVVVTHQAPGRTTLLPELLARRTRLPVTAAADRVRLAPNHAYIAPPGSCLSVGNEQLQVVPQDAASRVLPIDQFFRSIAHTEGENAIAIMLSGNGSDGSIGIAAIKGAAGLVLAQDPKSAQYPGMPASAIATQLVDYVLRPSEMPERLVRYVRGRAQLPAPPLDQNAEDVRLALQRVLVILRNRTGSDFTAYKKSTIGRRIERRMSVHGIANPADYARFLEQAPYEVDALFKELLISVTSFFRDPPAFEALEHELARLAETKADDSPLRAWVPACSSGEEAYSLAILVREMMQRTGRDYKVQIFATDLDPHAIEVARSGHYSEGIVADINPERLQRFFTKDDSGYRVNKDVREMLVFAVQNAIKDPPFTKLDLVSCRNLLIYLEPELQRRLLILFGYALRPDGVLMLGTSESVSGVEDRFTVLDKRWKLFQRRQPGSQLLPDIAPNTAPDMPPAVAMRGITHVVRDPMRLNTGVGVLAERILLSSFAPPAAIISERGELIYLHGRTGPFLEPSPGEPSNNLFHMAREGLRLELPAAVRQASTSNRPITRRGLRVKTNGGFSTVNITARRLSDPEALRGTFLVSFEILPEPELERRAKGKAARVTDRAQDRIESIEGELQRTKENLQGTIEELETSNEELKSTNEELQSTNEELQSANEELETSREEMQSLNEELQTVNAELEERNRALSQANDDMQNLLNSIEVATVFLDDKLAIKRFTTEARKVFSLIETDIGRPISDLTANLRYDGLVEDAREVMRTLVFSEHEIQTKQGAWRLMRIMPYRTYENLIDGLVITFIDIDRVKRAENEARAARAYAEAIVESVSSALLVIDHDLRVVSVNQAFLELFRTSSKAVVGEMLPGLLEGTFADPQVAERLRAVLDDGSWSKPYLLQHTFARGGSKQLSLDARKMAADGGRPPQLLLTSDQVI